MPRRRRNLRWVWGTVLLLAVIITVVILVKNNVFRGNSGDIAPSSGQNSVNTTGQPESKKDEKKDSSEEAPKKEEIPQYDGADPNIAEELSGVISYTGVSGGNLMIRVNIDQYLTDGKCVLVLARDGASIYNAETGIESSVTTSTCSGFDIPISELGPGSLKIKIELKAGEKSGTIEGEVNI